MAAKLGRRPSLTYELAKSKLSELGCKLLATEEDFYADGQRNCTIQCACGAIAKRRVSRVLSGSKCAACWTHTENNHSRKVVTRDGEFVTVAKAALFYGLDANLVYSRLLIGMSDEEAVGLVLSAKAVRSRDMEALGFIYKITNTANGKIYIGLTSVTVEERYKGHLKSARDGATSAMYQDMRKYGVDKFKVRTLKSNVPLRELPDTERRLIDKYDSKNPEVGYNRVAGGNLGGSAHGLAVEFRGTVFTNRKAFARSIKHPYWLVNELLALALSPEEVFQECEARSRTTPGERRSASLGTRVTISGVEYRSKREACRQLGLDHNTVTRRLHQGWNLEDAFSAEKFKRTDSPYLRIKNGT